MANNKPLPFFNNGNNARGPSDKSNKGGASGDTRQVFQGFRKFAPRYMGVLNNQILPTEVALQNARQTTAPADAALEAQIYGQYAPQFEQANADMFKRFFPQYAQQQFETSDALSRQADPEFYQAREAGLANLLAALGKSNELLGGMDPNRLTGAEMENVSRGLARSRAMTGDLSNPSSQGAIGAALTFDDRLQQKRSNVAAAIANAVGAFTGAGQFGQLARSGTANAASQMGTESAGKFFGAGANKLGANNTVLRNPAGAGAEHAASFLQLPADLTMLRNQLNQSQKWDLGQTAANRLIPDVSVVA